MNIMYYLSYYFLMFLVYSIIGYIVEMIFTSISDKKIVNRGFLIGPYLPIYGSGCVLIVLLLSKFINRPFILFILAMLVCMILEYLTSYIMEKLFNARWWDYSNRKFNINGRVCLKTTVLFGLGGLFIMYIVNPLVTSILGKTGEKGLIIIGLICLFFFLVDFIFSFSVILGFKKNTVVTKKDNTEDINKRIKDYLLNHSVFTKRLFESFPNIKIKAVFKRKKK